MDYVLFYRGGTAQVRTAYLFLREDSAFLATSPPSALPPCHPPLLSASEIMQSTFV